MFIVFIRESYIPQESRSRKKYTLRLVMLGSLTVTIFTIVIPKQHRDAIKNSKKKKDGKQETQQPLVSKTAPTP
jgi:hypothetical protein